MTDLNHPLQHDTSLKRLALTSLVSHIYKDPIIMKKLKEKFLIKYVGRSSFPFKALKSEIMKLAFEKLKILEVPKSLIPELHYMVVILGKKIVSWAEYVIRILKLGLSYLNEIYWTPIGTIDDAKIYNQYWKKHGSFNKILNNEKNYSFACKMACIYGNEKAILLHQNAMIKDVQKYLGRVNLPNIKNKVDQLAATYLTFLYGEGYDIMKEKDVHQRFKRSGRVSISDAIFVSEDIKAVKFLWKYLSNTEREKIVVQLARENVYGGLFCSSISDCGLGDGDEETEMIELAGAAEIVLFLLNQMSPEQKNQFLMEHASAVLQLLMQVWPYQEICLKLLDNEVVADVISQDGEELLTTLFPLMIKNQADANILPESCYCENAFHKLLRKAFSLISRGTKKQVLFDKLYFECQGWDFPDAVNKFYKEFDVNALGIIINDRDLKKKRDLMISMGSTKISKLIRNGELKPVLNFIDKVLIIRDERKRFIRDWNLENHPEVGNNEDFREKILTWLRD